jgi:hypothetical protein
MNYYASNVLHFWLAILGLWTWTYLFWRPYRLDLARENLFALRDELFTLALEEKVPFDHPAYKGLRGDLNSVIRFAEKMTVFRALITIAVFGRRTKRPDWETHLAGLPMHVAKRMLSIHQRGGAQIANYVILSSPVLMLLFWLLIAVAQASMMVNHFLSRLQRMIARPLEEQARDYRMAS